MKYKQLSSPPPVRAATRQEAFEFLRGLHKLRSKDDEPIKEAAVRDYLHQISLGDLQSISRRIMMDILKAPIEEAPDDKQKKPARARKSAQKKRVTSAGKKTKRASRKSARATPKRTAVKKTRTGRKKSARKR